MYNNPFMYAPYMNTAAIGARTGVARGLFSSIKAINWSGLLSNTQKTLGIINQTIPIVYQVKPIINNAKTMFKIASSMRDDNNDSNNSQVSNPISNQVNTENVQNNENKPVFFI